MKKKGNNLSNRIKSILGNAKSKVLGYEKIVRENIEEFLYAESRKVKSPVSNLRLIIGQKEDITTVRLHHKGHLLYSYTVYRLIYLFAGHAAARKPGTEDQVRDNAKAFFEKKSKELVCEMESLKLEVFMSSGDQKVILTKDDCLITYVPLSEIISFVIN